MRRFSNVRNNSPSPKRRSVPELLAGPYVAPVIKDDQTLCDEIAGDVIAGGYSGGRIPWPIRKKSGSASLILCDDLIRAVKTESSAAIQYWFGPSEATVWKWRKALGVDRQNNEGTQKLYRDQMPAKLTEERAERGRIAAAAPEVQERRAAKRRGKPMHPNTRSALLQAVTQPKPAGWGKRANAWMQKAKEAARTPSSATDPNIEE